MRLGVENPWCVGVCNKCEHLYIQHYVDDLIGDEEVEKCSAYDFCECNEIALCRKYINY